MMLCPVSLRFNPLWIRYWVSRIFVIFFATQVLSGVAIAQQADPESVKKLVQQEVERLLTTEGALDAAIEQGITRFILKQRELAAQAEQRQPIQAENVRAVDPQRDHIFGNPQAALTLVEYSDFECPFCKRFHPTVAQLMENNRDKLRWVYRHFPLEFHNPGAQKQAEASECVAELGGNAAFWEYSDLIYQRTKANGNGFPLANLRPLAEEVGIRGDAFDKCMASGRMTARVNDDHENGIAAGVSGTPAGFLMNRQGEVRFIAGALSLEELQTAVDEISQ